MGALMLYVPTKNNTSSITGQVSRVSYWCNDNNWRETYGIFAVSIWINDIIVEYAEY